MRPARVKMDVKKRRKGIRRGKCEGQKRCIRMTKRKERKVEKS